MTEGIDDKAPVVLYFSHHGQLRANSGVSELLTDLGCLTDVRHRLAAEDTAWLTFDLGPSFADSTQAHEVLHHWSAADNGRVPCPVLPNRTVTKTGYDCLLTTAAAGAASTITTSLPLSTDDQPQAFSVLHFDPPTDPPRPLAALGFDTSYADAYRATPADVTPPDEAPDTPAGFAASKPIPVGWVGRKTTAEYFQPRTPYLGMFVIRLSLVPKLRADLLRMVDRIRATLYLELVLVHSALSRHLYVCSFTLVLLAVSRCYGHRGEPDDYDTPGRRSLSYVAGEFAHAASS